MVILRKKIELGRTAQLLSSIIVCSALFAGPVQATCLGKTVDIHGTMGPDVLYNPNFAASEVIKGRAGNDSIYGYGGDDTLCGSRGDDYINGGTGYDTCKGGPGNDVFAECEVVIQD